MGGYRTQSSDTSADAERVLFDLYRRMEPWQRAQRCLELQEMAEQAALAGIRARHPAADEREQRLRLAALKYPRELMIAAFGWDPRERGY